MASWTAGGQSYRLYFDVSELLQLVSYVQFKVKTLGRFSRDRFWTTVSSTSSNYSWLRSLCRVHSRKELFVMTLYPFVGGVSGNPFKNLAREDLKISKTWIVLTSLGSRFHSLAAFTPKEFS